MSKRLQRNRTWLLATARAVAKELKQHSEDTQLRIRIPSRAKATNADGWAAVIGDLGKNQTRMEVWCDRFSGYTERKLCACYRSEVRRPLIAITKRVSRSLWPIRVVTLADTDKDKYLLLTERLGRAEFDAPVLEKYDGGRTFYGIYDRTRETAERVNPRFCTRAAAFFEDVARALQNAASENDHVDVYPKRENRKVVVSHLQHERSRLLAAECKIRDSYVCQVRGFEFVRAYGRLGKNFAEAHHRVPLCQLPPDASSNVGQPR